MSKYSIRWMAVIVVFGALMTGSAFAQGRGRGHMGGNAPVFGNNASMHEMDRDWRGDRDRWSFGRDEDRRPPGWSKGKKTGWGDCDVPPGQAKKMGCDNGWRRDARRDDVRRDRRNRRDRRPANRPRPDGRDHRRH